MEYGRIPAYCLAHDLGWKLPNTLPDGRETFIRRHDSIRAAQQQLASDPRGIHSISCLDAGEVIEYGTRLSSASLASGNGHFGIPTVILIDEIVSAQDANPYRLGEGIRKALALRRHAHIGLLWTTQSPRLCHFQMLGLSTEIVAFRLHHKKDLDILGEVGFTPQELDTIRTLPNYHYIVRKFG